MPNLPKLRILIADLPATAPRIASLVARHDVVVAPTLAAARSALLAAPFDVILVNVQFDESHMFEVIDAARSGSLNGSASIVCLRAGGDRASLISPLLLARCVAPLGVRHIIDLDAYPDDPAGNAALRGALERAPLAGD